jgi:hypothetical protein
MIVLRMSTLVPSRTGLKLSTLPLLLVTIAKAGLVPEGSQMVAARCTVRPPWSLSYSWLFLWAQARHSSNPPSLESQEGLFRI